MLTKVQIAELKDTAHGLVPPVLTLYAQVNPGTHTPQAIKLRAKETLKSLAVPDSLVERVTTLLGNGHNGARTLVLLADATRFETIALPVELPVVDPATGHLEAHYGEPYLAPLFLALDDYERYAIVHVTGERVRLFEVFLGECVEIAANERWSTEEEDDRLEQEPQIAPGLVPGRDSAAKDRAEDHVREWSQKMYRDCAKDLTLICEDRGMSRIVLMGPDRAVHAFAAALPTTLRDRVVGTLPSLSNGQASAQEVLERVTPTLDEVERNKEAELLTQIRERGMWGLDKCLRALQQGQLYSVAVPWTLDRPVYRDAQSGYVAASAEEAKAAQPNGKAEETSLRAALPALAEQFNVHLEFIRGENRERLLSEFGGMAALKRW